MERLLDDENISRFKEKKLKVLYCNDGVQSNSAWMTLTQFGITNIKVLEGGINSNSIPGTQAGDEILKFDVNKVTGADSSAAASIKKL